MFVMHPLGCVIYQPHMGRLFLYNASTILYIELVCDGRGSDQSWSVGVVNGMSFLTSFLVSHTTTCLSVCIQ